MAICFFDRENPDFYVTEFAHSLRDHTVYIKSRVREEYLLHIDCEELKLSIALHLYSMKKRFEEKKKNEISK